MRPERDPVRLVPLVVLAGLVVGSAWVSDDAFITLRTLDNFLEGYGLRYNPAERVQAFTHPLWLAWLTIPYALTREAWLTTMVVGFATTMASVGVAALTARDRYAAALGVGFLAVSKAFVDYGTSGLEGPLVWLLLALFGCELYREGGPRFAGLLLLASLVGLTRLDALLFVAPGLALAAWPLVREREWSDLLWDQLAWLPLIAWHAFSLVYYGSLVPNTAWAKLGSGIASSELAAQAPWYFQWAWTYDPATLPLVAVGVLAPLLHRDARGAALSLGIVLYLAYIVRIGGDFMGGRFLATPLFAAAFLVTRHPLPRAGAGVVAVMAVGLSLTSRYTPLRAGYGYHRAKAMHGVVDERGFYWRGSGLRRNLRSLEPSHLFARQGRERRRQPPGVVNKAVIGMYGYYAGPEVHIVDRLALADPVLARLPVDEQSGWRIGHFERRLPDGYLARRAGIDAPVKPDSIAQLVEIVDTVTRSEPLFSWKRFDAIRKLHDGTVDALVRSAPEHYPRMRWVDVTEGRAELVQEGVGVRLDSFSGTIELDLTENVPWRIIARQGDRVLVDRVLFGGAVAETVARADGLFIYALEQGAAAWSLRPAGR